MKKKSNSEIYQKYIIRILLAGAELHTVYGPDLSQDESDKLLIDENFNILLFEHVEQVREYIDANNQNQNLFDKENLIKWVHLNENFAPQYTFNLDEVSLIIKKIDIEFDNFENKIRAILDFMNLFKDYYYQIASNTFDEMLRKTNLGIFLDFAYDGYPWKTKYETLEQKYEEMKNQVNISDVLHDTSLMFDYLRKRCRVW